MTEGEGVVSTYLVSQDDALQIADATHACGIGDRDRTTSH